MAAPIRPAATKAFTREKWQFVPVIANTSAPTLVEIIAAAGLDVSCYLFDSTARPGQNTNTVTLERRVCDGAQYEQIGITTYSGGEALWALDPQAAAGSDGKKAWEKLTPGTKGFFVRRLGIDVNTDFAVGQFVDVFPVELGPAMPTKAGDGEAAEVAATQTFAVTSAPAFVKAIV